VALLRVRRGREGADGGHGHAFVVTPERGQRGDVKAAGRAHAGRAAAAVAPVPHHLHAAHGVPGHDGAVRGGGGLRELQRGTRGDALTGSAQRCHCSCRGQTGRQRRAPRKAPPQPSARPAAPPQHSARAAARGPRPCRTYRAAASSGRAVPHRRNASPPGRAAPEVGRHRQNPARFQAFRPARRGRAKHAGSCSSAAAAGRDGRCSAGAAGAAARGSVSAAAVAVPSQLWGTARPLSALPAWRPGPGAGPGAGGRAAVRPARLIPVGRTAAQSRSGEG